MGTASDEEDTPLKKQATRRTPRRASAERARLRCKKVAELEAAPVGKVFTDDDDTNSSSSASASASDSDPDSGSDSDFCDAKGSDSATSKGIKKRKGAKSSKKTLKEGEEGRSFIGFIIICYDL